MGPAIGIDRVAIDQEGQDLDDEVILEPPPSTVDEQRVGRVGPVLAAVHAVGAGDDHGGELAAPDLAVELEEARRAEEDVLVNVPHVQEKDDGIPTTVVEARRSVDVEVA